CVALHLVAMSHCSSPSRRRSPSLQGSCNPQSNVTIFAHNYTNHVSSAPFSP
ncbi:hypothetical protein PIB30_091357, partial [Stylosanthes scabra]|nr:hypothetical protein [Stylosanthes scabra]